MPQPELNVIALDFVPLRPHCDHELTEIASLDRWWSSKSIAACPACRRLLGIGGAT